MSLSTRDPPAILRRRCTALRATDESGAFNGAGPDRFRQRRREGGMIPPEPNCRKLFRRSSPVWRIKWAVTRPGSCHFDRNKEGWAGPEPTRTEENQHYWAGLGMASGWQWNIAPVAETQLAFNLSLASARRSCRTGGCAWCDGSGRRRIESSGSLPLDGGKPGTGRPRENTTSWAGVHGGRCPNRWGRLDAAPEGKWWPPFRRLGSSASGGQRAPTRFYGAFWWCEAKLFDGCS